MSQHTGALMVLLPSDALLDEHCTIIYLGDDAAHATLEYEPAVRMARTMAATTIPFRTVVSQHNVFGSGAETVEVAELEMCRQLRELRGMVEGFNASEYKEYKPHITKTRRLREENEVVYFNRLALWHGQNRRCWLLGVNKEVHSP